MEQNLKSAAFGAGCFWGVEETFRNTEGVTETEVGYTGGKTKNPTYEEVCSDATGHAEAVKVVYDPSKIKYEDLLKVFFENHNPTQFNRQGPDYGSQYRSVIFYYDDEQKNLAEKAKEDLQNSGKFEDKKIVTQIVPAAEFYRAEEYHQKYLMKRGADSCHI